MGGSDNNGDASEREEKQSCDYKGGLYRKEVGQADEKRVRCMAKGSLTDSARGQSLGRREQWTAQCGSNARTRLGRTVRTPD